MGDKLSEWISSQHMSGAVAAFYWPLCQRWDHPSACRTWIATASLRKIQLLLAPDIQLGCIIPLAPQRRHASYACINVLIRTLLALLRTCTSPGLTKLGRHKLCAMQSSHQLLCMVVVTFMCFSLHVCKGILSPTASSASMLLLCTGTALCGCTAADGHRRAVQCVFTVDR